jgi:hypothetical protein
MAKSGDNEGGDQDASMAGHLLWDMLSSVALGIVEMRDQLATSDIPGC